MNQLAIRDDAADFLRDLLPTVLEGWQLVLAGDGQPVVDKDYPLLRVRSAGMAAPEPAYGIGSPLDGAGVGVKLTILGYVSSPLVDDAAEIELAPLICNTARTKGLFVALMELATMGCDAGGLTWLWEIGELDYIEPTAEDRWTKGVSVPVTARTTL